MIAKLLRPAGASSGFLLAVLTGAAFLAGGATNATAAAKSKHSYSGAKTVYQAHCSVCHGDNGAGSHIGKSLHVPDLRSSQVQSQSDQFLGDFIRHGKGSMPPFGSKLSSAQIDSLVKYVRHLGAAAKKK